MGYLITILIGLLIVSLVVLLYRYAQMPNKTAEALIALA